MEHAPNLTAQTPLDALLEDLFSQGWHVAPSFITPELALNLLNDARAIEEEGKFRLAGIGRSADHHLNQRIRNDFTHWLDGTSPAQLALLSQMDELRQALNRRLFLGLNYYECHYAHYESGGFYQKHRDSFRGQANRIVTTVLYLNQNWQAEDGGELALYDDNDLLITHIQPTFGTLVCFLSEEFPHEVLPAYRDRWSIAGWFRLQNPVF